MIRYTFIGFALLASLLGAVAIINLPPAAVGPVRPAFAPTWHVARGAFHVHSERSDGTGTLDEIAAAASRAGLQFVILTDHGDGTRGPEPPSYRSGVLMIDGVEISTSSGHYAVIDLPQTPYRLAGDPAEVVEDVRRFGGFGFAAHPGSPKDALRWGRWETSFDGVEWLNADSEWRDEFWSSLGRVLLTYPFRPTETLGTMLDRPNDVISAWETATRSRRVPAIAGADAHARLAYQQSVDPYEDRVLARVPGYEVSFRAFVNHVILRDALTGDAQSDAQSLVASIREGYMFTSIDALAQLSAFEMKAISGGAAAIPGGYLSVTGPVAIEAAIAAPAGTSLVVWRNDEPLYETREPALRIDVGTEPGAYRIEARLPWQAEGAIPWVFSNPIYVGLAEEHARHAAGAEGAVATMRAPIATEAWTAEASSESHSVLNATQLPDGTPAMEWTYRLGNDAAASPFAALRFPVTNESGKFDRLQLRAESDAPRRVWVQLRTSGAAGGARWGKTFYVGPELTEVDVRFEDFRPLSGTAGRVPLDQIDSLLLVVDTVNTIAGSSGRIAFTDLWFAR